MADVASGSIFSAAQTPEEHLSQQLGTDYWRLTPATHAYRISSGAWIPAKHLQYISARIAYHVNKKNGRLIVSLPPRHGKSELLSVYTPVWIFDQDPRARVILASYGSDLATDFSRRVRDIIKADETGDLRVRVRADKQQVANFLTNQNGAMYAVGVGGPITGRGADLLLIDDYLKNAKDANSHTMREATYEWLISTALTRLEPGGSAVILATRWHMDDVIGRLLEMGGWEYIQFPAIAGENDIIGRQPGEPLWPERYDYETLMGIKQIQGTYYWSALYQQEPIPRIALAEQGNISIVDAVPTDEPLLRMRYWDLATSPERGDYTVGAKIALQLSTERTIVEDIIRFQGTSFDNERAVRAAAEVDGRTTKVRIEQEGGSSGKAIIEHYKTRVLKGYDVEGNLPTGDKYNRAQPMFTDVRLGLFCLLRAEWNANLIKEFRDFSPDCAHDDQVDACSGAHTLLFLGRRRAGVTFGRNVHVDEYHSNVSNVVFGRQVNAASRILSQRVKDLIHYGVPRRS